MVDPSQPLSSQGRKEVETIAGAFLRTGLSLEAILHSEKLRAHQTAEILHKKLQEIPQLLSFSYLKPNDPIEPLLRELDAYESLMVVGHLPYLEQLLAYLLTNQNSVPIIKLSTAALAALSEENGRWQLDWLITPDLISPSQSHLC